MNMNRNLHLMKIKDSPQLNPNNLLRQQGMVKPPSFTEDYYPVELKQLLEDDLHSAQLTIEPSYFCNLHCQFCELPVNSRVQLNWDRLHPVVQLLRLGGLRWVVLAGGEPGIAADTIRILEDLGALGMRVSMLTHGMWATNKTYLDKMIAAGLSEVNMSIKSVSNKQFKLLCGSGSFDRQMKAVRNFSEKVGCNRFDRLVLNYVVTQKSPSEIEYLFESLQGRNINKLILTFMEPYVPEMIHLSPTMETMAILREKIRLLADTSDFNVEIEGFPLCHMHDNKSGMLSCIDSSTHDSTRLNQKTPKITLSPKADADYLSVHYGYQRYLQYRKLPACKGCARLTTCPGIHQLLTEKIIPLPLVS